MKLLQLYFFMYQQAEYAKKVYVSQIPAVSSGYLRAPALICRGSCLNVQSPANISDMIT